VYFVLGCCLFSSLPYGQVLRELTAGLEGALAGAGWRVPASTALTEVRRRVGEEPLKVLLGRVAGALSPGRAEWSHVGGLLAVAWDGTTVAVPGTDENAAAFGKPAAGKKSPGKGGKPAVSAGFPLVRLVALVACGTRAVLGAGCGPVRGKGSGEQDLARGLLGSLGPGMLLLADRNFCSYALWNAAAGTGADLLWRAKASMHLPVIRVLPDGSWLAHVNDPRAVTARNRKNGSRRVCQIFCAREFSLSGSGCLSGLSQPRYLKLLCPVYLWLALNRTYRVLPGLMLRVLVFFPCRLKAGCRFRLPGRYAVP
jgi:hypothetical protein